MFLTSRRFVLAGLFYSGMYDYDSSMVFVSLGQAATLLADDPLLETGLELRVRDLFKAPSIARALEALSHARYQVTDWTQANAALFSALNLEKFADFLVLLLIVLVAAFNITATLVMVVLERRKELAILRAAVQGYGLIA